MKRQTASAHHLQQGEGSRQANPPPVLAAQVGELVEEDGDDRLHGGELGAEAEGEKHHEEEDGPEGGDWHPGDGLGVGDEGEPGTWRQG